MWRVLANEPANHYITGIDAPRRRRIVILIKTKTTATSLPSKADIVAFIGKQPGKVGTREIARAFGLKNALRAELKRLLRDLADEGAVETRHKKLHHPGALPSTVLADVVARDSDGDLIATPDEWDEEAHGAPPKIRILVPRHARRGEAAGLGDRVLLRVKRPKRTPASATAARSSASSTGRSTACSA